MGEVFILFSCNGFGGEGGREVSAMEFWLLDEAMEFMGMQWTLGDGRRECNGIWVNGLLDGNNKCNG